MKLDRYQTEAAVTISTDDAWTMAIHAVLGIASEMDEFLGAVIDEESKEHIQKEIGDCCWMLAELCTANGWKMQDIVSLDEWTVRKGGTIGELCGIYQKVIQGHPLDEAHVRVIIRGLWAQLMQYCKREGFKMQDILDLNIKKLRKRYPNGFEAERSMHRKEGDV